MMCAQEDVTGRENVTVHIFSLEAHILLLFKLDLHICFQEKTKKAFLAPGLLPHRQEFRFILTSAIKYQTAAKALKNKVTFMLHLGSCLGHNDQFNGFLNCLVQTECYCRHTHTVASSPCSASRSAAFSRASRLFSPRLSLNHHLTIKVPQPGLRLFFRRGGGGHSQVTVNCRL